MILKTEQTVKIERHNAFTEEINNIALSSNDDKECNQLIWFDAYGIMEDLLMKKKRLHVTNNKRLQKWLLCWF